LNKRKEILKLREQGHTQRKIAKTLGLSPGYVGEVTFGIPAGMPEVEELIGVKTEDFSEVVELKGNFIVVGDVHVPTTNWKFASYVSKVAVSQGIKRLVIVGDLLNFDSLSDFSIDRPVTQLRKELKYAKKLLNQWAKVFDEIHYFMGNHENRFFRSLKGELTVDLLGGFFDCDNLNIYRSSVVELISNGVLWRATHQANYSRVTGNVAEALAEKYQCNIITHHEHKVGILRSKWGRYTLISNGGLHDHKAMWYVNKFDTTSPVMQNSFVVLQEGVAHLLTPYTDMTDWSRWI